MNLFTGHEGLPQMELQATWPDRDAPFAPIASPGSNATGDPASPDAVKSALLALLADPNIASKEHLVRQYDHEVQGGSIVKPMCGLHADGPTDGAVLKPRYDSWRGITVTHGINPRYGDVDTYHMAAASVDEAVRAHVALGGDPQRMAALDNFCWPDPVLSDSTPDGPFKLAQLVRACRGLADACVAYGLPLISGKDSMKNDSYLGGRKVSIRPTLLVSLMGIVPDVRRAVTSNFKTPGDRVLLIGTGLPALGGSAYERYVGHELGDCPHTNLAANPRLYRAVHAAASEGLFSSLHDISDGGLGIALAEAAIGGRLGARITLPTDTALDAVTALFGERTGTFIATCSPEHLPAVKAADHLVVADIGEVTGDAVLHVTAGEATVTWSSDELIGAWQGLRTMLGADRRQTELARPQATLKTPREAGSPGQAPAGPHRPGRPTVLLLTGYGINANLELAEAFRAAGANVREIHLNDFLAEPGRLESAQIFALPGGFSYGDHVGSGLMLAHRLRGLQTPLNAFRDSGGLILGICNGFQVLVKLGILPDLGGGWKQEVSLVHNDTGRFEDSWVTLEVDDSSGSPWLRGISQIEAPIRRGEIRRGLRCSSGSTEERRTDCGTVCRAESKWLGRRNCGHRGPNGVGAGHDAASRGVFGATEPPALDPPSSGRGLSVGSRPGVQIVP